jgi:hypothetical protein
MEFEYKKTAFEKAFTDKMPELKAAYTGSKMARLFVKKGKDDHRGRCYMINFVTGSDYWLASPSVNITLWQEELEFGQREQAVELILSLAKANGFKNIKVVDETEE